MATNKSQPAEDPTRRPRDLSLRPTSAADLDALAQVSATDQARIAARFRATTLKEFRPLLDGPAVDPNAG